MKRRQFLKSGIGTVTILSAPRLALGADMSLLFDPNSFTEMQTTVSTTTGDVAVTYRFWRGIPYVSRPADIDYQTLNVSVPVRIGGEPVDASNAPILFSNGVGGYFPKFVGEAEGIDAAGLAGPGGKMPAGLSLPPQMAEGGAAPSGSAAMQAGGKKVSNAKLALAAGLVVIEPGSRGRTLLNGAGEYYGVAPAQIVDLKAALRYVRFNKGRIPGNTDRIVSSGSSAGGAMSALVGASADSSLYDPFLEAIGAADASDAVFAVGAWCPITDLENADMAYEWNWGGNPPSEGGAIDAGLSAELRAGFASYQAGLALPGINGFGTLTADNYGAYLLDVFLRPAATAYLAAMSEAERTAYLAENRNIKWADGKAQFDWVDFLAHAGTRKKALPAFDGFDLSRGENNLFGLGTEKARHFTPFALRHSAGDGAQLASDIPAKLELLNPMGFLRAPNANRARHWWLRTGAKDTDTSLSILGNLSAITSQLGDNVDTRYYWDGGHGANDDAEAFIIWIKQISAG